LVCPQDLGRYRLGFAQPLSLFSHSSLRVQSSEELKGLLETALANQKEALIAHWGGNVDEEGRIDGELKWLKGVDPTKADKAALKALAAAKMY